MYGQTYNHADIIWRIQNKAAITPQELANLIAGDEITRLVFMVANNPANVNNTLRHERGYENLPFAPSQKELIGLIDMLHKKGDEAALQHIINNFQYNHDAGNWTTAPALVECLKAERLI